MAVKPWQLIRSQALASNKYASAPCFSLTGVSEGLDFKTGAGRTGNSGIFCQFLRYGLMLCP